MEKRMEMPQEMFDILVQEAIADLLKSGLEKDEILRILEEQFGREHVRNFSGKALKG